MTVAAAPPTRFLGTQLHVRIDSAGMDLLNRLASSKGMDASALARRMLAYAAERVGQRAVEEFGCDGVRGEDLWVRLDAADVAAIEEARRMYANADPWGARDKAPKSQTVRRMLQFAVDNMPPAYRAPFETA